MNKYMDNEKLTPTLLAKTKGLEKCIIRCGCCNGSGLVKKEILNKKCSCLPCQFCYLCQNKYKYGNYGECDVCYGMGVVIKKRKKEKINYNSITN